jgi:hypothetical protein
MSLHEQVGDQKSLEKNPGIWIQSGHRIKGTVHSSTGSSSVGVSAACSFGGSGGGGAFRN